MGEITLPGWAVGVFSASGLGLFSLVSFFLIRTLNNVSESSKDLREAIDGLRDVVAQHHTEIALLKATKLDR